MKPKPQRTPKVDWKARCMDAELDVESAGESFLEMRDELAAAQSALSQAQRERDEAKKLVSRGLVQETAWGEMFDEMKKDWYKANATIAAHEQSIAERDARIGAEKERFENMHLRWKAAYVLCQLLREERDALSLFLSDCQLLLAQSRDTLCGTKFIQAGGLQEAFKRYAERCEVSQSVPARDKEKA
jgi:hypothetical protein